MITLDATANSANISSGSSFNWNISVAANPDRMLIVGVSCNLSDAGGVLSVTAGGVAMKLAVSEEATTYRASLFYLPEVATGVVNVVVSVDTGTFDRAKAGAISIYNSNQNYNSVASQASSETNPWDFNITTTEGNTFIADILMHRADDDWEPASPQVEMFGYHPEAFMFHGMSYKTSTPSGSIEMQWDRVAGTDNRAGYGAIVAFGSFNVPPKVSFIV